MVGRHKPFHPNALFPPAFGSSNLSTLGLLPARKSTLLELVVLYESDSSHSLLLPLPNGRTLHSPTTMLRVLPLLAAVPLVTAFLPYIDTVPDTVTTDDSCVFPEGYVIDQFTSWTPSASNNRSSFFGFGYTDQNTSVSTTCEWNSTSKAVIPGGASPRYACDNPLVEFIWENGTIDLIEKICVGSSG